MCGRIQLWLRSACSISFVQNRHRMHDFRSGSSLDLKPTTTAISYDQIRLGLPDFIPDLPGYLDRARIILFLHTVRAVILRRALYMPALLFRLLLHLLYFQALGNLPQRIATTKAYGAIVNGVSFPATRTNCKPSSMCFF